MLLCREIITGRLEVTWVLLKKNHSARLGYRWGNFFVRITTMEGQEYKYYDSYISAKERYKEELDRAFVS